MSMDYICKYAILTDGQCWEVRDATSHILRPDYIPIKDDSVDYLFKYYHPAPQIASSFDDFQGLWYLDAAHTQLFDEGNA